MLRPAPDRLRLIIAAALVLGPAAIVIACDDDVATAPLVVDAGVDVVVIDAAPPLVVDAGMDAELDADAAPIEKPRGRDKISETGLYADIVTKTIAADAIAFTPEFTLWSDGAEKKRWVRLPKGATIDTTDPDHWILPVGTQLFKEFSLDGKRLETRLVERIASTGQDSQDYFLGAFLWHDDESDADFVKDGANNVRATPHDVPAADVCMSCHLGEPGHALGFSALQLSHDGVLGDLHARGFLGVPLADHGVPGAGAERTAVGTLHANCGHCHNINGVAWPDTNMVLRVSYGESVLADTKLVKSTVGVALTSFSAPGVTHRIAPGDPDASAVAFRPSVRGDSRAMPPLATEYTDDAGVTNVRTWIASLDAGAP